jgi:drug/metabolite transporter (DMT)-like permease
MSPGELARGSDRVISSSVESRQALVGRLCVLGAAVMWSSNGFFAKAPLFADWEPADRGLIQAFWRALFGGLVLLPAVRRPRWTPALVPMIAAFAAMNVTYLQCMALSTAANAAWLQAAAPIWVLIFGVLVWREPLNRRELMPLVFGMAGVGLIVFCELVISPAERRSLPGVMMGVASGVCYAVVVLSMRRLRGENSAWLIALNLLATAAILAPFCLPRFGVPSANHLGVLCAFGVLQMGIPYLLMASALRRIGSQEASGIGLIEPVLVPVWVYFTWGEVPAWWTMVGGVAILCGLALRYRGMLGSAAADRRDAAA